MTYAIVRSGADSLVGDEPGLNRWELKADRGPPSNDGDLNEFDLFRRLPFAARGAIPLEERLAGQHWRPGARRADYSSGAARRGHCAKGGRGPGLPWPRRRRRSASLSDRRLTQGA